MMRFADQRARFNRRFFNHVALPLSGKVPMWSIIEHRGRRSGAMYRTPVSMFPTADGVAILLAYGDDRDWVRNVLAAGGGRAVMGGKVFDVSDPRIAPTAEAAKMLRSPWRQVFGAMSTPSTLLLRRS
jgi:deazaflavin-dependent oxidoreductase (nitroreductase family)